MDRRQRLLIAVLALMIVGYLGDQTYRRLYERPLAAAEQRVTTLEQELHDGQLEVRREQNRLPQLDDLKYQSLPSNLELAVTEYRSWLLKVIEETGLEKANLDSGSPNKVRNLYTRIDFSLRTQGTLSQVTELLHAFYRAEYLHKIRSLSLLPTADGTVDVSMTIETLTIPAVAQPDQLPMPYRESSDSPPPLDDYYVIARRNLFRAGEPPAATIKLSAITSDVDQNRQAWLSFLRTGETRILAEGDGLTLEGSSLRVVQIGSDAVEFEIDGRTRNVRIGQTLEPADEQSESESGARAAGRGGPQRNTPDRPSSDLRPFSPA